jgi:hypothetical protein
MVCGRWFMVSQLHTFVRDGRSCGGLFFRNSFEKPSFYLHATSSKVMSDIGRRRASMTWHRYSGVSSFTEFANVTFVECFSRGDASRGSTAASR